MEKLTPEKILSASTGLWSDIQEVRFVNKGDSSKPNTFPRGYWPPVAIIIEICLKHTVKVNPRRYTHTYTHTHLHAACHVPDRLVEE